MADEYLCKRSSPVNVLLVDNHSQIRSSLEQIIPKACSCVISSAATAAGAIMKMTRAAVDLVFTELSLPDADGKWLIETIRRQHPGVAVIVLSEDDSAQAILDALRAGADDFIHKPINDSQVTESVGLLLARLGTNRRNNLWRYRTAQHMKSLRSRRKRLADQVQLVCQDLVGGYQRTVEKLLALQTQQDCCLAIQGQLQLKPLLGTILRYLSDTFNGASGAVFLAPFTSAKARLFTAIGGGPPANIDDYDHTLIDDIINRSVQSNTPLIGSYSYDLSQTQEDIADTDSANTSLDTKDAAAKLAVSPRSLLASGLHTREKLVGAIVLQRKRRHPFRKTDAELLANLVRPIAEAIEMVLRLESENPSQDSSERVDLQ